MRPSDEKEVKLLKRKVEIAITIISSAFKYKYKYKYKYDPGSLWTLQAGL